MRYHLLDVLLKYIVRRLWVGGARAVNSDDDDDDDDDEV